MEAFTSESVVPEILDTVPPACLQISYGETSLNPGHALTPTQVKDKPKVTYDPEPGAYYSLICIDHDAPSRSEPKFADILHWLIINIQGSDITSGNEVTQYIGSGAPKGSGLHRYVIVLFKQTGGEIDASQFQVVPNTAIEGRRSFNTREFISKHGLELTAGNFFQAEWDEYVPQLHKQLGFTPAPKWNEHMSNIH